MTLDQLLDHTEIREDGCWVWTGYRDRDGYGHCRDAGATRLVHRSAYELLVEPISSGLELDHLCIVRHCLNPDHLDAVTHAENVRRQNAQVTSCRNGHEFDETNTYIYRGRRHCRACNRTRARAYYRRTRGAAS